MRRNDGGANSSVNDKQRIAESVYRYNELDEIFDSQDSDTVRAKRDSMKTYKEEKLKRQEEDELALALAASLEDIQPVFFSEENDDSKGLGAVSDQQQMAEESTQANNEIVSTTSSKRTDKQGEDCDGGPTKRKLKWRGQASIGRETKRRKGKERTGHDRTGEVLEKEQEEDKEEEEEGREEERYNKGNEENLDSLTKSSRRATLVYLDTEQEDELDEPDEQYDSRYKLDCIVSHEGSGASAGHYVAHVFDYSIKKWKKYDDSIVTEVGGGPLSITPSPCPFIWTHPHS